MIIYVEPDTIVLQLIVFIEVLYRLRIAAPRGRVSRNGRGRVGHYFPNAVDKRIAQPDTALTLGVVLGVVLMAQALSSFANRVYRLPCENLKAFFLLSRPGKDSNRVVFSNSL